MDSPERTVQLKRAKARLERVKIMMKASAVLHACPSADQSETMQWFLDRSDAYLNGDTDSISEALGLDVPYDPDHPSPEWRKIEDLCLEAIDDLNRDPPAAPRRRRAVKDDLAGP
jgi:hypothetical protein